MAFSSFFQQHALSQPRGLPTQRHCRVCSTMLFSLISSVSTQCALFLLVHLEALHSATFGHGFLRDASGAGSLPWNYLHGFAAATSLVAVIGWSSMIFSSCSCLFGTACATMALLPRHATMKTAARNFASLYFLPRRRATMNSLPWVLFSGCPTTVKVLLFFHRGSSPHSPRYQGCQSTAVLCHPRES